MSSAALTVLPSVEIGFPPAKSGAGGRGRLGLPPYSDEGVPGRGLPCSSAGSYGVVEGGGLIHSVPPCEGVHGLEGEPERVGDRGGMYRVVSCGGAMDGISSRTDFDRA